MGTRGVIGVVINGEEKFQYNQYDMYPDGVGVDVLKELWDLIEDVPALYDSARSLKVHASDSEPDQKIIAEMSKYSDTSVSTGSLTDWYCLLRETQGSLKAMLECGHVEDSHAFPVDSLFCEYAYVVDLDDGRFEVYKGFQKTQPSKGRWASHTDWTRDYAPCDLWASWPLLALPTRDEFLSTLRESEDA